MTNEQILRQAIEKAEKNGWKNPHELSIGEFNLYRKYFSHDFAKAFWGGDRIWRQLKYNSAKPTVEKEEFILAWQYHLQQMVISEDPIQYLKKYL